MSKLATLTDDFPGSSLNASLWYLEPDAGNGHPSGVISISGGVLSLHGGTYSDEGYYTSVNSQNAYDLTGSYAYVQVTAGESGTGDGDTGIAVLAGNFGDGYNFDVTGGNLQVQRTVGDSPTVIYSVAYNATSMAWLKISEASGTITFSTAPDGVTWTSRYTTTTETVGTWTATASYVQLFYGSNSGGSSPTGTAGFGSFNVAPVPPPPTAPFTVTITVKDNVTGETGTATGTFNVNNASAPPPPSNQCAFGVYDPSLDSASWSGIVPFEAAPVKVATFYTQWDEFGGLFPTAFANVCKANNAIPFIELEPWYSATGGKTWPAFNSITSGSYDSLLTAFGTGIATFGSTVWVTFAHEQNGSWYPWGNGGAQGVTPAQWIAAWKHVHDVVNSTAHGYAKWVWAPNNADVGSVIPYWPGSGATAGGYVDIPAYDGYLNAAGQTFASFQQQTINQIQTLTDVPIWNSECGIEPADSTRLARITPFIDAMHQAGMAGFMHWNQSPFNLSTAEIAALTAAVNAWKRVMANPVITSVTFDKAAYNKGDVITCTVKYSDSNVHGVVNGTGSFTAAGALIQGSTLTPSITTIAAGDLVLLHVVTEGSAPPTAVSGGNCTWEKLGQTLNGSVNSGFSAAVFAGTVTTVGTATATVTAAGASAVRIGGQEFHASSGQWVFVSQANLDVSGSNTGPVLNPTAQGQLYSFYGFDTGTATLGQTAGFTYEIDSNGNPYAFNPACALTAQAPVFGDTGVAFGIAVLMSAPLSAGTFTTIGTLMQSVSDTITISPQQLGDLVLMFVYSQGGAPPSGVDGGNCNWEQVGTTLNGTVNSGKACTIYAGTAIATGGATATVSFTGTPSAVAIDAQEFYSSTGQWALVTSGGLDVFPTTTSTLPALTPTAGGQLYFAGVRDSATFTAGSTPGYTYEVDSLDSGICFNPSCTSAQQAPVCGDDDIEFGLAVLMSAGSSGSTSVSTPASSPLIVSIATAAGTDPYGNPYPQGLGVEKGVISGASLTAGNTLTVDDTGLSVYNGAPTAANLQLSITPAAGIVTKSPVVFDQFGGTPIADPAMGGTAYSAHGDLEMVDGLDQQAYATQRRSIALGADGTVSSTSFHTFLSSTVAAGASAREYRVHAQVFILPNQTGGKAALRWTGPGSTVGHLNFVYTSGTAADNTGALANGTSTSGAITMTMVIAQEIDVVVDGTIQVPAGTSGSFTLDAANGTSGDTFVVREFTYVDVMPV